MPTRILSRTPEVDAAARVALARGERVLTWSNAVLVELTLDDQGRLIETPRPDLIKAAPPTLRARLERLFRSALRVQ